MKTALTVVAMMSLAASAGAQVIVHEHQSKTAEGQQVQLLLEKAPAGLLHVTFEAPPVTGAPYSGEALTESVQVLADGNRIVKKTAARVYRDSKGRTRKETLGSDGQVTTVFITDPAGGKSYSFEAGSNTAHSSRVATFVTSTGTHAKAGSVSGGTIAIYTGEKAQKDAHSTIVRELEVTSHVSAGQAGLVAGSPIAMLAEAKGVAAPSTKENLGQQVIEGVTATGTRTTTVIAAGSIGNEQPITVVAEEWFSQELKVLVMTRHVDPRIGETTYRLTGINRAEPNPSLFELPAGVTVK